MRLVREHHRRHDYSGDNVGPADSTGDIHPVSAGCDGDELHIGDSDVHAAADRTHLHDDFGHAFVVDLFGNAERCHKSQWSFHILVF